MWICILIFLGFYSLPVSYISRELVNPNQCRFVHHCFSCALIRRSAGAHPSYFRMKVGSAYPVYHRANADFVFYFILFYFYIQTIFYPTVFIWKKLSPFFFQNSVSLTQQINVNSITTLSKKDTPILLDLSVSFYYNHNSCYFSWHCCHFKWLLYHLRKNSWHETQQGMSRKRVPSRTITNGNQLFNTKSYSEMSIMHSYIRICFGKNQHWR